MNTQRILEASEALSWLVEQATAPAGQSEDRAIMALTLAHAQLYLVEYAAHASRGLEPYDALMSTIGGELVITPRQRDMLRVLMPPPVGPAGPQP